MGNPDSGPPLPPRRRNGGITTLNNVGTSNKNGNDKSQVNGSADQQSHAQALLDANDTDMRNSLKTWRPLQPD